jgi:EAL domain-containing protein (putative c-di-GMP-specific phosphodiesterase class I)
MNERLEFALQPGQPYLEHYPDPEGPPQRVVIAPLPFRLGRSPAADCVLYSRHVSSEHTEIYLVDNQFHLRDLGSTNGTFLNGQPVLEAPLTHGDIIHVAKTELRFSHEPVAAPDRRDVCLTERTACTVTHSVIRTREHLREMLKLKRARPVFQPIVFLSSRRMMGYEVLARGDHPCLSSSPAELLRLANECNLAVELSEMFRCVAVHDAARLPRRAFVFVNLHPSEMTSASLIPSLISLKAGFPDDRQLVLEVHEAAVTDPKAMIRLREQLDELGIGLAYDDFGAGQSRLKEFADVPPDFIKLDMSLIRGIDHSVARQDLVRALVHFGNELGVGTIAEGIETEEESAWCRMIGCQFGQGYLFGRPQPVDFLDRGRGDTRVLPKIADTAPSRAEDAARMTPVG